MFLNNNLEVQAGLLGMIIDSVPDGLLAVDSEGRVIMWNRAVEEMTGLQVKEVNIQVKGVSFSGTKIEATLS